MLPLPPPPSPETMRSRTGNPWLTMMQLVWCLVRAMRNDTGFPNVSFAVERFLLPLRCVEDGSKRPSSPIDPSSSSPEEEVAPSDTPRIEEARFFDLCLCPQRGADPRCVRPSASFEFQAQLIVRGQPKTTVNDLSETEDRNHHSCSEAFVPGFLSFDPLFGVFDDAENALRCISVRIDRYGFTQDATECQCGSCRQTRYVAVVVSVVRVHGSVGTEEARKPGRFIFFLWWWWWLLFLLRWSVRERDHRRVSDAQVVPTAAVHPVS